MARSTSTTSFTLGRYRSSLPLVQVTLSWTRHRDSGAVALERRVLFGGRHAGAHSQGSPGRPKQTPPLKSGSVTRGTFSSSTSSPRPYDSCIEKFTLIRGCPWGPPLARMRLRTCTWSSGRSTYTRLDGPGARTCIIELDGPFCTTVDVADSVRLFQMTS